MQFVELAMTYFLLLSVSLMSATLCCMDIFLKCKMHPTQLAAERNLATSLVSAQRNSIWRSAMLPSKCVRYGIIQFKILRGAYVAPVRLSKISKSCWFVLASVWGNGFITIHFGNASL